RQREPLPWNVREGRLRRRREQAPARAGGGRRAAERAFGGLCRGRRAGGAAPGAPRPDLWGRRRGARGPRRGRARRARSRRGRDLHQGAAGARGTRVSGRSRMTMSTHSSPDPRRRTGRLGLSGSIARRFQDSKITPLLAVAGLLLGLFAVLVTP